MMMSMITTTLSLDDHESTTTTTPGDVEGVHEHATRLNEQRVSLVLLLLSLLLLLRVQAPA